MRVQIKFKNYGQTPAYGCRFRLKAEFDEFPDTDLETDATDDLAEWPEKERLTLGPSAPITFTHEIPGEITEEMIAMIEAKTHAIYVFGIIRYTDAFGGDRHTVFRYAYNFSSLPTGDLTYAMKGNYAN